MTVRAALLVALALAAAAARAGSPHPTYTVPWHDKKEQLTYRSCGCADSCWVAELRERRTKRVKATLRCDCEQLLLSWAPSHRDTAVGESCDAINHSDHKMDAIAARLKTLLEEDPSRPIGLATMRQDGTLVLDLRAESGGAAGHSRQVYRPGDEGYQRILGHLGGLKPGEEKPVPPFPYVK